MPRSTVTRANFAAGQIDTSTRRDPGKAIYVAGMAQAQNLRIVTGNAVKRRAGTWQRAAVSNGKSVVREYTSPAGDVFLMVFSQEQLDIYDTTGALIATKTGMSWGSSVIDDMYVDRADGDLIVSHTTFWPQVISVNAGGVWTVADFVFDAAPGGGVAQPYYRYAAKGVTLQPSALTGSITVTASADVFTTSHIGTYIRYLEKEILITAYTSPTVVTGTVIEKLPSTVTVVVASAVGYLLDAEVQGVDSGAKGVITNVSGTTMTIVYKSGLTGFTTGEVLVADGGSQSTINSGPTGATAAAIVDWDEQAISAVHGYPGCAAVHRGRLYFTNLRDLPRGLIASAAGFPKYFLVGPNDGDAFFELLPDYQSQRALHLISASQGLVLTDRAAYFLPEYGTQVITPSTIDFHLVDTIGAGTARPISTEQGFAFVENGTNRVMGILPSGSNYDPWEIADISAYWSELLTDPRGLGTDLAITSRPERYAYAVNSDGTIACVKYEAPNSQVPLGWTPWSTRGGAFRSITPAGGKLFAIVQRNINGSDANWFLEEFDEALYMDSCLSFTGSASTLATFASSTVSVMSDDVWYRGDYSVDGSGNFTDFDLDDGTYIAGIDITTAFEPTAPAPDHPAYIHGERIGIPRLYLHVEDTGSYYLSGQLQPAYRQGESLDEAPTLRSEARRLKVPGRAADLSPVVTQRTPGPLQILAAVMEVSF